MRSILSAENVVEAGVQLVAKEGWSALSLRAVAGELGVTPMALYRHVGESDALSAAVVECIVARSATVEQTGDVVADLTAWARRFHEDLGRYPGVAGHLLTMWFESPAVLERVDDLLALVGDAGLDGFEAVATTNAVFTYVLMRCEAERAVRTAGVVRRQLRTATASRPLPRLEALAAYYTTAEFGAHFEFGLEALAAGLPLPRTPRTTRRPSSARTDRRRTR